MMFSILVRNSGDACGTLFSLTTLPDGARPTTTWEAILNIARNPAANVKPLFASGNPTKVFEPSLTAQHGPDAPDEFMRLDAFTLAMKFNATGRVDSNGQELCPFGGPGNFVFDTNGDAPRHVKPSQRKILETSPTVRMELLAWGNTAMEPHLFRVKPGGGSGESYAHEGEEFLHVLRGNFELWLNEGTKHSEHYLLRPGHSLYFESSTPHRWKNPGRSESWILWINTPPTF